MNNHAHILDTLYSLKDMGFKLSMDDFGTGYSSEGVEDTETYKRLKALGCDVIQGYLVGKAMPLADLIRTIKHPPPKLA